MRNQDELFRLSLGTLRCIREVTSSRSIPIAAERLGISQAAVSQHIAKFEKLSGMPVLSSSGNGPRSGALLPLLDAVAEVERSIGQILEGASRLRVGVSDCLASHYYASLPTRIELPADIDLQISNAARLVQMFQQGGLDVVIGPLPEDQVDAHLYATTELVWIAGTWPGESAELPVVLNASESPYAQNAEAALKRANIRYRVVARVDDQLALLQCVANGLGCAVVPAFMVDHLPKSISVVRDRLPRVNGATIGMMRRKLRQPSRSVARLFDSLLRGARGVEFH